MRSLFLYKISILSQKMSTALLQTAPIYSHAISLTGRAMRPERRLTRLPPKEAALRYASIASGCGDLEFCTQDIKGMGGQGS